MLVQKLLVENIFDVIGIQLALTSEVSELPKEIRILGEDLVIFKTTENKIGLVHKNCPHRRASLVYGKCEKKGIRCCYHGWLFSPDGEILETPGEDPIQNLQLN